ncbi:hypothetical protein BDQ17DRAFT_190224 [Cyathus striatus]|nr:hypothetical protein BDQ17DRAFT_190224 [Cyathus striatus]
MRATRTSTISVPVSHALFECRDCHCPPSLAPSSTLGPHHHSLLLPAIPQRRTFSKHSLLRSRSLSDVILLSARYERWDHRAQIKIERAYVNVVTNNGTQDGTGGATVICYSIPSTRRSSLSTNPIHYHLPPGLQQPALWVSSSVKRYSKLLPHPHQSPAFYCARENLDEE